MKKWTNEQIDYLKEITPGRSEEEITNLLNQKFGTSYTKSAVNSKKKQLKIYSNFKYCTKYTEEVIQFMIDHYKGLDNIELAALLNEKFNLNLNKASVSNAKTRLKKQGINLRNGINRGCFKKGQESFNKGKKWDEFMSKEGQANSRTTCFKKGNIPINHREVGSERINVDGYLEIKVAEPNIWKLKHRVIYEEAYGPIPEGHMIIFADSNKLNLNLDNLILITLSENLSMNRNGLRFNDAELTKTGLNITKINVKMGGMKNERRT